MTPSHMDQAMRRICATFLALTLLIALPAEAADKPADVTRLARVSRIIEKGIDNPGADYVNKVTEALITHRLTVAKRQARNRGFAAVIKWDDPRVEEELNGPLRRAVKAAIRESAVSKRRDRLYDALIEASSENLVDAALGEALGFSDLGKLVSHRPAVVEPHITGQVQLESDTSRLVFHPEHTKLLADVGGPGEGNKVLDAGEWVQLAFAVTNESPLPYFSSSAFLSSESTCLWVPPSREFLFPELPPAPKKEAKPAKEASVIGGLLSAAKKAAKSVAGQGPVGAVSTWVYISQSCSDGQRATVRLEVQDTHRTRGTKHVLRARILVRNRVKAKAVKFLVDHDVPGWSDGVAPPPIAAARQFELSHGVSATRNMLLEGHMGWEVQDKVDDLIESSSFRGEEPMLFDPRGTGELIPGDDFDLETVDGRDFQREISEIATKEGWQYKADARMLMATDVLLLYRDDGPRKTAAKRVRKITREERIEVTCQDGFDNDEDGMTDCDDPDCEDLKICICGEPPPKPLPAEQVVRLLEGNAEIAAKPAVPDYKDAISAVSVAGYELRFDDARFKKLYKCALEGIPASRCGHPICKDCDKKPAPPRIIKTTEEVEEEVSDAGTPMVPYRYRYYFEVPVEWRDAVEICGNRIDDDSDGATDCADSDCQGHPSCRETDCGNKKDDDRDGRVDCADSDCRTSAFCAKPEICEGGVDEDLDGDIDCADSECSEYPGCDNPWAWLEAGVGVGIYNYQKANTDDTNMLTMPGGTVRANIALLRLFNPLLAPLTVDLEAWFDSGGGNGASGFGFHLGYMVAATNTLELQPYIGLDSVSHSFETLGGEDVELDPESSTGLGLGVRLRYHPLEQPGFFILFDVAFRRVNEAFTDTVDPNVFEALGQEEDQAQLEQGMFHLDLGVGYRF